MYNFILQIFLIASLSLIIYIMARSLPRVQEKEDHATVYDYLENLFSKLPLAKADRSLNIYLEKTIRKTRVIVMRLDNFLHNYLVNKKNNQEDNSNLDFIRNLGKKD